VGRQDERIYVGPAVANKKFRFLSVSQIKLFDPISEGCNRKWAFQYLFKRRLLKTGALTEGADYAEKMEHYLKTNEDLLPPVLQKAKLLFPRPGSDLQVERPLGPDFPMAVFLREALLKPEYAHREDIKRAIRDFAGLTIHDIPLDGAPDVRYFRDIFITDDGMPAREVPGTVVIKIEDLKVISRIWPQRVHSGPNAGTIYPGYAKTSAQVCDDVQMLGYARRDCDVFPEATHFRLGHIYAEKKSKKAAKRSGIISRDEVIRRWRRVEDVGAKMIQVATADRIEDIEPTPASCDAYTHVAPCGAPRCGMDGAYPGFTKNPASGEYEPCFVCKGKGVTAKGCGHRYYCPLSNSAIVQNMISSPFKESSMSLFNQLPPGAMPTMPTSASAPVAPAPAPTPAAPPPPVTDARAAIEAEKARLRQQDADRAANAQTNGNKTKYGCGAPGCGVGCTPGQVIVQGGVIVCPDCKGRGGITITVDDSDSHPAPPPPPPAPVATQPNAIKPPDAPPAPGLLKGADPVPLEERMQITDPALRQTIEDHAAQHAQLEVQSAAAGSVWCPESGQTIKLSMEMAIKKKYECSCAKVHSTKTAVKAADGSYDFTVPRHKPKNKPVAVETVTTDDDDEGSEPLATTAAPPPPPAERPGFFTRMLTPKHEAPEPPTRMVSYKFDASGHFTAKLANGETWDQEQGDSALAHWNKPAGTYAVQIEPSSSTYHLMKVGSQVFMVDKE